MWVVLDYTRYLNHILETDNHHGGMCQIHLSLKSKMGGGRHIKFRKMSIAPEQTTGNDCKVAFSLHVVDSISEDYNF